MQDYLLRIEKIKKQLAILRGKNFVVSPNGTHYEVFLSKKYVVRFRDNNPKLLLREADFLQKLNHHFLIPKVLWVGRIDQSFAMIERRLPGKTMNLVWKGIPTTNKINIIKQIVEFLQYQRTQTKDYVYSVNTGKKYKGFWDYLTDGINQKIVKIKKFKQTNEIMKDLLLIINKSGVKDLFTNKTRTALVHGDLIIHNLLTDSKNLTGVLDWELALFGDPDYDLFRLFYYQECAKTYQEQDIDETFEADYMDKLITAILKSKLIKEQKSFREKYYFVRAIFYLNALNWAVNSDKAFQNINELIGQWKKRGAKHLRV